MILKLNDRSTNVALWQAFLVSRGFNITPDSHFGTKTQEATRLFQFDVGLAGDGMVGPDTIAAAKAKGFAGFPASNEGPKSATPTAPTSGKLSQVHPKLAAKVRALIEKAAADGFELRVTQGLRTFAEQNALYAQGRTRKGPKVTNAAGGQSNHNYGLACDVAFIVDGEISWQDSLYTHIGPWAASVGLDWGGNWKKFKDFPHVELPDIPKWQTLLEWQKAGGINAVWARF